MKRRLLILTGLLASCAQTLPTTDALKEDQNVQGQATTEFITARSGKFYLGAQEWRFVGGNMAQLVYQPMDQVVRELDYAKRVGLTQVRVSISNNCWENHWDIISKLSQVVAEAKKRDLRLTVALASAYNEKVFGWERCKKPGQAPYFSEEAREAWRGDEGFYTNVWNGLHIVNDSWIDWGHRQRYWPIMRDVVWHFRDEPTIFSWDVANEVGIWDRNNASLLVNFYKNAAREIKALAPRQLVTTGVISGRWAIKDANIQLRDQIYTDANIDYLTVHMYQGDGDGNGTIDNTENQDHQRDDIYAANVWYKKPVVIEEFGADTVDWMKSKYAEYFVGPDSNYHVDGIMHWGVTARTPRDPNWGTGTTNYSPLAQGEAAERQYRALWTRWSSQLGSVPYVVVDSDAQFNNPSQARVSFNANSWKRSTYSLARWGTDYYTSTNLNGTEDGFQFLFYLPTNACKTVFSWFNGNYTVYHNTDNKRSNGVPYVMYNAQNQHLGTAFVDQSQPGDKWVQAGSQCYNFTAGWNRVVISRWTNSPTYLVADAVLIK